MNWRDVYAPGTWLPFSTAVVLIVLSVYSWHRRSMPGALQFAIGSLFAVLWAIGSVMEYAAVDLAVKISWVKFQAIWQLPTVTAITCFVLEYTWPGRWLTRRNIILLSIIPLLAVAMILTDNLHHLAWHSFGYDGTVRPWPGVGSWIGFVYASGLNVLNIFVFGWLFIHSPQQRSLVVVMATGLVGSLSIYLFEKVHSLHGTLPLDILAVAFLFLMCGVALFSFHILDPIPIAHQLALEQIRTGVLVLDREERVASLNSSAESILQTHAKQEVGRPIRELLPAYPDDALPEDGAIEIEFSQGTDPNLRSYTLAISLLKDWRGIEVGRLLLLRDVTEQRQVQAQIMEQQQILVAMQERERLARELHDSIGQVLGYASFQLEAVAKLSRDGQVDTARKQLDRVGNIIRGAHADVREYILNLRSAPSQYQPFFTVLQQYLEGFSNNYEVQAHLNVAPILDHKTFSADTQLQLFRIVQEALSNARNHGGADQIELKFDAVDERIYMIVLDNGCGFSTDHLKTANGQHFGLQFMRERAAQLGGSLQVQSAPGKGTQVIVEFPEKDL